MDGLFESLLSESFVKEGLDAERKKHKKIFLDPRNSGDCNDLHISDFGSSNWKHFQQLTAT